MANPETKQRLLWLTISLLLLADLGYGLWQHQRHTVIWLEKPLPASLATLVMHHDKPMLINFFASWCLPCLAEHPQLMAWARDKRLAVVGVVYHDTKPAIEKFLATHGNPYAQVITPQNASLAIDMGVRGVPESFFISRDGVIIAHWRGGLNTVPNETNAAIITRLLAP